VLVLLGQQPLRRLCAWLRAVERPVSRDSVAYERTVCSPELGANERSDHRHAQRRALSAADLCAHRRADVRM
jgi:hypothetical protein